MNSPARLFPVIAAFALLLCSCAKTPAPSISLRHFSADDAAGIVDVERVTADPEVTADGGGSLRIDADGPLTIRLYEVDGVHLDNSRIIYRAMLRTENLNGEAYLEMWCHFPDHGDYFSRDMEHPHGGSTEWVSVETPFFLQEGQMVESIRLNLVIMGTGTVWIDAIDLLSVPLNP